MPKILKKGGKPEKKKRKNSIFLLSPPGRCRSQIISRVFLKKNNPKSSKSQPGFEVFFFFPLPITPEKKKEKKHPRILGIRGCSAEEKDGILSWERARGGNSHFPPFSRCFPSFISVISQPEVEKMRKKQQQKTLRAGSAPRFPPWLLFF